MSRLVASTLLFSLVACGGLADIRPEALQTDIPRSVQDDGAQRFSQMVEAHGGMEAWSQFETVDTTFRDEWTNWLFFQITPYAQNNQLAALHARLQEFPHGRIEFLEGKGEGEVWTAKGNRITRDKRGKHKVSLAWEDSFFAVFVLNPEFMVGTPFRLASADHFAHVGTRTWKDKEYDVVLLSWGDFAPQERLDQWLLYIDPDTGLLAATEFTIRMSGQSQTGFYHYRDYQETEGLMLAHAMDAYLNKNDKKPVHRYAFDAFELSTSAVSDAVQ
ncbi:MAG: hypothetical protein AAGA48_22610 [Myxococcota bacterium]